MSSTTTTYVSYIGNPSSNGLNSMVKTQTVTAKTIKGGFDDAGVPMDLLIKTADQDTCGVDIPQTKDIILDASRVQVNVQDRTIHFTKESSTGTLIDTDATSLCLDASEQICLKQDQHDFGDLYFDGVGNSKIEKTLPGTLTLKTLMSDISLHRSANTEVIITDAGNGMDTAPKITSSTNKDMIVQSDAQMTQNPELALKATGEAKLQAANGFNSLTLHGNGEVTLEGMGSTRVTDSEQVILDAPEVCIENSDTVDDDVELTVKGNATIKRNLFVEGDLHVKGMYNQIETTVTTVQDKCLVLATAETGNTNVYYVFDQQNNKLVYKKFNYLDVQATVPWIETSPNTTLNLYEGVTYFWSNTDASTPVWSTSTTPISTPIASIFIQEDTASSDIPSGFDSKVTISNVVNSGGSDTTCLYYHTHGEYIKVCFWDASEKITHDGVSNDGAGISVEGRLPSGVNFTNSNNNVAFAEKSFKWNHGDYGILGFDTSNPPPLDYSKSSARGGSFWELKGGGLQLTRFIHGWARVYADGTRKVSSADIQVSYRFEIDDTENLQIVKVAGSSLNPETGGTLLQPQVIAMLGGGVI